MAFTNEGGDGTECPWRLGVAVELETRGAIDHGP